MAADGALKYPIMAVNEAKTKHLFDNRYGTGQSTLDGVIRATNRLIAGRTVVVSGYGWCGRGIASRADGMGASVIVLEVDPMKALEAVMDGYRVMPAVEAAKECDIWITVTGDLNVIDSDSFDAMKDGAIICNSGHFNVEINIPRLREMAVSTREVRPLVDEFTMADGRRIYLLAEGRLVNLSCAEGHPANVMDMSFANQALAAEYMVANCKDMAPGVYDVPEDIDNGHRQAQARDAGRQDRHADRRAGEVPRQLERGHGLGNSHVESCYTGGPGTTPGPAVRSPSRAYPGLDKRRYFRCASVRDAALAAVGTCWRGSAMARDVGCGELVARRRGMLAAAVAIAIIALLVMPVAGSAIEYGHSHITGTITSDGATPLFNVQVVAYRSDGVGGWLPASGAQSHRDGTYDISGLLAGTYRILYNPIEDEYPNRWNADKRSLAQADDIVIGPASTIAGVDANLAAGHVTGRAINSLGDGIAGVTVSAYEADDWGGWTKVSEAVSAADGTYDVGALRSGTHRVMLEASHDYLGVAFGGGDSVWSGLAVDVPVTAGMTNALGSIILSPAGHVAGQVTNDGSTGIPNITVRLYERDGPSLYDRGTRTTAADGTYDFGGLKAGVYHVGFSDPRGTYPSEYYSDAETMGPAADISVSAGSVSTADAELTSGRIRGTVVAYGAGGVPGIEARVYRMQGETVLSSSAFDFYTDADGNYDIGGLPALVDGQKYRIAFIGGGYDAECYQNAETLAEATDLDVGFGQTVSNIDGTMEAGRLSGRVTSDGSTGIPGVWVSVYANGSSSPMAWQTTGADGSYSFAALPTGNVRLHFYEPEGIYRDEYSGDATDLASAALVSIGYAGSAICDAQLAEFGHITGRVTSDASTGLPGVHVMAWTPDGTGSWRTYSATTEADGSYDIVGLGTGGYRVAAYPAHPARYGAEWFENAVDRDSAVEVTVSVGSARGGVDVVLDELAHLTGTVSDGAVGIDQITVAAYRGDGTLVGGGTTDSNGAYTAHLPTGDYRLEFTDTSSWNSGEFIGEWHSNARTLASANPVSLTSGATATVDAVLARAARITGVVRAPDGAALGGMGVTAWPSTFGKSNTWGDTASDGSYELGPLEPETYKVSFYDAGGTYFSEWYDDAAHSGVAQSFALASGDLASGVDATLTTGGHIAGKVTSDGTTPLPGIGVVALRLDQYGKWSPSGASGYTAADGTYDIPRLQTGTYRVKFADASGARASECYDDAAGPGTADDVGVVAGSTTLGIDAILGPAGSVEGTVTLQAGGSLGGLWVYAFVPNGSGGWDNVGQASTDASGTYRIDGLRPGDYRIEFVERAPHLHEYYDDASSLNAAADVTVVAEQITRGISAELNLPSDLAGRVTSDGVTGIAGICVRAERPDGSGGWLLADWAYTTADGDYVITDLEPGVYRVKFDGDATYVAEYYNDTYDPALAAALTVVRGVDTTGIDAVLAPRGHVAGRVTSDGSAAIADVSVTAYTRDQFGFWATAGSASTGADGTYDIAGLLPGAYRVQFENWTGGYVTKWFDDSLTRDAATDVTVTAGATTGGIDAVLPAPARITGAVSGGGGPLAGASVRAYLSDGGGGLDLGERRADRRQRRVRPRGASVGLLPHRVCGTERVPRRVVRRCGACSIRDSGCGGRRYDYRWHQRPAGPDRRYLRFGHDERVGRHRRRHGLRLRSRCGGCMGLGGLCLHGWERRIRDSGACAGRLPSRVRGSADLCERVLGQRVPV